MMRRRPSRALKVGPVAIGGGAPVVVQSMTKTDTRDAAATLAQVQRLAEAGCEVVRVAVPDQEAAQALPAIKKASPIPVIADIHFDHRLALAALRAGVDGLRLNPGNIRDPKKVEEIVREAKARQVPIRIGVNAGSLPPDDSSLAVEERMVSVALEQVRFLEGLSFDLIKVSLKAFDVPTTLRAYRLIAERMPYPLHLGITEAGLPFRGAIRSAVGLGILLHEGLGDTIRVSLTTIDPVEEVVAAYEILKALNLRERGPTLISCPTCGRLEVDLVPLARAVEERLERLGKNIKVAVMGCLVNGPGEAREADVGIACGKGRGVIFRKGEMVRTVEEKDFLSALMAEIEKV